MATIEELETNVNAIGGDIDNLLAEVLALKDIIANMPTQIPAEVQAKIDSLVELTTAIDAKYPVTQP